MIRYDSTTLDLVEVQFEFNFLSSRWRRICKNNERSLYGCGYNVVGWVGVIDDMRHHKQYVMSFTSEYVLDILQPFSSCKVKLPYNFNLLNLLNNFKQCLDIAFFLQKPGWRANASHWSRWCIFCIHCFFQHVFPHHKLLQVASG